MMRSKLIDCCLSHVLFATYVFNLQVITWMYLFHLYNDDFFKFIYL